MILFNLNIWYEEKVIGCGLEGNMQTYINLKEVSVFNQ